MGRALTSLECLNQARECLDLAAATSDADLRLHYLNLASNLTNLAAALDIGTTDSGTGDVAPRQAALRQKRSEPETE